MRFVKPIDEALILELAEKHTLLVTLEENTLQGGAGSAVSELLSAHGVTLPVLHLGLPDTFLNHGKHTDLLNDCGLSVTGIMASIRARIARISTPAATPKSLTF